MQKIMLCLSLLLVGLLSACRNFTSEVAPLPGNEKLNTFTEQDTDGETILTGVIDPQNDKIIVSPREFVSLFGDSCLITGKTKENKWYIYKVNGEMLGVFDGFVHWTDNGDYYQCGKYGLYVLHFPQTGETVSAKEILNEYGCLILFVDGKWQLRDSFGKLLWTIPQNFTLLRDANSIDHFIIAINEGRKYTLYDKNGTKLKTLSAAKWQKEQLNFENLVVNDRGAATANVKNLNQLVKK